MAQVTLGTEIVVTNGSLDNLRPRVALTANDIPVVMWSDSDSIYTARWNGTSFDPAVTVVSGTYDPFTTTWGGPDIAAKGDTVFISYKAEPEATSPIILVKSTDGGQTWGTELEVVPGSVLTRFADVAVDENGQPTVNFMEFQPGFTLPEYATITSTDYGATFGPIVNAAGGAGGEACDCCESEIISNNGEVVVMYRGNISNLREHWMVHSNDNGATFPSAKEIDTTNYIVNACMSSGPSGIFYYDSLATVWMSAASGIARVYVSTLDRTTWNYGVHNFIDPTVGGTVQQNHPRIAGNDNMLGVVWEYMASGNWDVKFNISGTGAAGLIGPALAVNTGSTSGNQLNPDVKYNNNMYYIVWQDDATNSVMYRTVTVGALSTTEHTSPNIEIFPNPATDVVTINSEYKITELLIFDMTGRAVHAQPNNSLTVELNVSEFESGSYFIQVTTNSGIYTQKLVVE